ncbi:MAG: helix-turn-helix domain-containing protein [Janthinobacterium lividum]
MDIQYKGDPRASTQPLHLDGDHNLSNHLTYQDFKDVTQDQFDDGSLKVDLPKKKRRLQLAALRPLNWDYLRVFYYVVKAGSFTKAAPYLYLSQPAISRAIENLEVCLGEKLLLRASSPANATITLTPAEWMVLEQVNQGAPCFDVLNAHALKNHNKRKSRVES